MDGSLTDAEGNTFDLRPVACPTCRAPAHREIGWRGGKYHRYAQGIATRIVQCEQCSLLFASPFPFPRTPQKLYGDPSAYFAGADVEGKVENGRTLLRQICTRMRVRSDALKVLDVGSGRGELVEAARREGIEALGLEFSSAMIADAHARFGIELHAKPIEALAADRPGTFDAIVMNGVLEHVHDPDAMISAAATLAKPGGLLYVNVPNEPNLLTVMGNAFNRLRGSRAVYNLSPTWPPYHVFGFNPRALGKLLAKHGFEVLEITIWAAPVLPTRDDLRDRVRGFVGTQVNRLANLTRTAGDMVVWARRR